MHFAKLAIKRDKIEFLSFSCESKNIRLHWKTIRLSRYSINLTADSQNTNNRLKSCRCFLAVSLLSFFFL